jgi:hypothetical protein
MTFDESLYLLHYCRLLYKTIGLMNNIGRAAMLRVTDCYVNWLLDTLDDVERRTTLLDGSERQRKLKGVLVEYQNRYRRELKRNPVITVGHDTIVNVTKQMLEYLDKKIMGDPEVDQLDLVMLGHSLCTILEVTEVLRFCRERGDFSAISSCRQGLDACLNAETQSFSVSTYLVARGKLSSIGYCM